MSTTMDTGEQHLTILESTSTQDGEFVMQGRRKRLRKKTATTLSPKAKQQRGTKTTLTQNTSQVPKINPVTTVLSDVHVPPNIYVRKIKDYKELCSALCEVVGQENFKCRSRFNDIVISSVTSDAYRAIIKHLNAKEADFHCYQLPEDKAYRVVIRNLHYSTPPEDITKELTERGYHVKAAMNVRHPTTKAPLPLFFVDLEKTEKSRNIFKEKYLLYTKISVEEPRRRNGLMQCHKCQEFNHSQRYCSHIPKCVKCGEEHNYKDCQKPIEVPASCANCGGNHPANYRGCEVYKALRTLRTQRQQSSSRGPRQNQPSSYPMATPGDDSAHFPQLPSTSSHAATRRPNVTYASLLSSSRNKVPSMQHSSSQNAQKTASTSQKNSPTPQPSSSRRPHFSPDTENQFPESTLHPKPQDPFNMMTTFLNKLETLITPLISLMTSLLTDILPKLLK